MGVLVGIVGTLMCCVPAHADDAPTPIPVADVKRDTPISFEKEILPILSANCLACHNRTKAKGDLVLETPTDILKGGESGPGVVAKKGEESLLLKVAAHRVEPVMPPKGNKVAATDLSAEQLGLIKLWIDQGATGAIGGTAGGASVPAVQWQAVPAGLKAVYAAAVTPDGQFAAAARGAEAHVYHLPTGRLVARLGGHRDLVQSLAFSPDGNVLASGAYREVKLWKRQRDVKQFSVTQAARGGVNAVDVSPDGATFVTGGADGVVRVWSMVDGRPVKEMSGHGGAVTGVRFSPDGAKVASVSADKTVRVWNMSDGGVLAQTPVDGVPLAVAWMGAGKQVAAAGEDGVIRVWHVPGQSGAALASPKELKGHAGAVRALAALPGAETHLLSGGDDGTVRRWDVGGGAVVKQVSHGAKVESVAVRPDGKRFASAGGNVVRLWDAEGKQVAETKGDRYANEAAANRERDLAFAASEVTYHKNFAEAQDKRHGEQVARVKKGALADVEADKALAEKQKAKADADAKKGAAEAKKKEADGKKVEAEVKKAEEEVKGAAEAVKKAEAELDRAQSGKTAAGDEMRLAIKAAQAAADGAAEAALARDAAEREHKQVEAELAVLKGAAGAAEKAVRAVAFSRDGALLAAGGEDGVVRTYGAETGAAYETYRGHGGAVTAVAFGPIAGGSGTVAGGVRVDQVVSAGGDGAGVGWALDAEWQPAGALGTGDEKSPIGDRVTALDFGPDGKRLVTGGGVASREGEVMVWDVETGALVRKFEGLHSDAVLAVDWSADGKLLATAAADRFVKVSEVSTGTLLKTFEGHTGHVLGVAFQRAGRTLASGSADNAVKVWDLVSGEQKKTIPGFEKEVTAVRFVGDSDTFVATAGDGKVRLLRPDGGEVRSFQGFTSFVYAAAVTRDGTVVVAGGEDGNLRAWNGTTGQPLVTLPPPPDAAPGAIPTR